MGMTIRELTRDELPMVSDLFREFHRECVSRYVASEFTPSVFEGQIARLLELGIGCVFGCLDGDRLVGFIIGCLFLNSATCRMAASESYWYVLPGYRGRERSGYRLVEAFNSWATAAGAKELIIGHMPHTKGIERYLNRRGFRHWQQQYVKEL